jgi:nitroimidazol reductase NimA-like FMN-containing flavoprotein (pyridoxamine 5'-phosphate oxidase superfamily)
MPSPESIPDDSNSIEANASAQRMAAMIGLLHQDEIEEVLHHSHIGRLASLADGRPYVVPITYVYAGDAIYGHTMPGRKVKAMRTDPYVCFEVDERDGANWRSVVAEGVYEELHDEVERRTALRLMAGTAPTVAPAGDVPPGIVFRIRLTEKSGRFVLRETTHATVEEAVPLARIDIRSGDTLNWPQPS